MDESFSIEELTARVGIPVRTLRYYIAEGLIPGPGSRGKGARYGPEHLWRLQLIRRLTLQRVPLAQIRERLEKLSQSDAQALLEAEPSPEQPSPRAYLEGLLVKVRGEVPQPVADVWRRHVVHPGVELHVRGDVETRYAGAIRQALRLFEQA